MTGASSADSRISVRAAPSSSSSRSSIASATASSRRLIFAITVARSSGAATTRVIEWPVISLRSSIASTFDGSTIAISSRLPDSSKPIGAAL